MTGDMGLVGQTKQKCVSLSLLLVVSLSHSLSHARSLSPYRQMVGLTLTGRLIEASVGLPISSALHSALQEQPGAQSSASH